MMKQGEYFPTFTDIGDLMFGSFYDRSGMYCISVVFVSMQFTVPSQRSVPPGFSIRVVEEWLRF